MVSSVMNVLFLLMTTVRASKATGSSMYSMPLALASSISFAVMGRLASQMSISLRRNFLNPPLVPDSPTVTWTFLVAIWNSSATAAEIGKTVLDPSILIWVWAMAEAAATRREPTNPTRRVKVWSMVLFPNVEVCGTDSGPRPGPQKYPTRPPIFIFWTVKVRRRRESEASGISRRSGRGSRGVPPGTSLKVGGVACSSALRGQERGSEGEVGRICPSSQEQKRRFCSNVVALWSKTVALWSKAVALWNNSVALQSNVVALWSKAVAL
jgi:hypothetical protein